MKLRHGMLMTLLPLFAGCELFQQQEEQQAQPRAEVELTHADQRPGTNQRTRQANVDCVPGRRVTVYVELTGNFVRGQHDSLIGEALCDGVVVADANVATRQTGIIEVDSDQGTQTSGPAACRASWAFITPSPNPPAWKVKCTFD